MRGSWGKTTLPEDSTIAGKLRSKSKYWQATGASNTIIKWINNGFRPIFSGTVPPKELPTYNLDTEETAAWEAVRAKWVKSGAIR